HRAVGQRQENRVRGPIFQRLLRRRPPLRLVVTRRAVGLVHRLGIDTLRADGPTKAGRYGRNGEEHKRRTENRPPCFFAIQVPSPTPAMLILPFMLSLPSTVPVYVNSRLVPCASAENLNVRSRPLIEPVTLSISPNCPE